MILESLEKFTMLKYIDHYCNSNSMVK